ncbi:hypothetical protein [Stenotrophomonas panacihumi]|nr:hypothetical protein [Stenotrophomonas panacihumi]
MNALKLTMALARSGATLAPNQRTGFWRALSAYARVREACLWQGNELRAQPHLLQTLRDSSRTALAGDLGQAMTWLYATEKLKMSAVVDFGVGCGLLAAPVPAPKAFNKRPDFMAATGALKDVVLLESKGMILEHASGTSWRSGLADGLEQTTAGVDWLNLHGSTAVVANKYAVSFGLVEKGPSLAVVVDPPAKTGTELDAPKQLALLRHHAASWALAAGEFELAAALVDPEQTRERMQLVELLPEVGRHGVAVKVGLQSRRERWYEHVRPVHFISSDLIRAVARNDLEGALAAIAAFNSRPGTSANTREMFGIVDRTEEEGFVALPDGTAAEWWPVDGMIRGPE